jgi:hypothetical protein
MAIEKRIIQVFIAYISDLEAVVNGYQELENSINKIVDVTEANSWSDI